MEGRRGVVVEIDPHESCLLSFVSRGPAMKKLVLYVVLIAALLNLTTAVNATPQAINPPTPPSEPQTPAPAAPTPAPAPAPAPATTPTPAPAPDAKPAPDLGVRKLSRRERKERIKNLSEKFRQFLTDVEPVMNPTELDTFLI